MLCTNIKTDARIKILYLSNELGWFEREGIDMELDLGDEVELFFLSLVESVRKITLNQSGVLVECQPGSALFDLISR